MGWGLEKMAPFLSRLDARLLEKVAQLRDGRGALTGLDLVVVVGDKDARVAAKEADAFGTFLDVDLRVLLASHEHVLHSRDCGACRRQPGGRGKMS